MIYNDGISLYDCVVALYKSIAAFNSIEQLTTKILVKSPDHTYILIVYFLIKILFKKIYYFILYQIKKNYLFLFLFA